MGKRSKQGAALRAKKRADIANQQLEQAMAEMGEQERVQSKKDEELFVLDTARKESTATSQAVTERKRAEKEASKKRKVEHSERHARKIQKVLKDHGKDGAIALAAKGQARLEQKRIRRQISAASNKPTFDLWDEVAAPASKKDRRNQAKKAAAPTLAADPIFDPPTQPESKLSNKQLKARKLAEANAPPKLAVEVAHPGQSYHPDKEHHQDAIGEALSIEIRRNEAVEYKARPISEGVSAYTKEFIVNSDDEEDSDDDTSDEEEEGGQSTEAKIIKRKEKLTRAQRNKQKRVKAEQTALKERRTRKQFLHQANEVHIHNKAVKKAEQEQAERQQEIAKLKKEKKSQPLGKGLWSTLSQNDPIRAPSLPVALTSELAGGESSQGGGGLRTIAPKGSLVTDRLESMVARNMMSKKKVEGRRIVQGKKRPKVRGAQGTEYLLI